MAPDQTEHPGSNLRITDNFHGKNLLHPNYNSPPHEEYSTENRERFPTLKITARLHFAQQLYAHLKINE